jgi:hypothetical protein
VDKDGTYEISEGKLPVTQEGLRAASLYQQPVPDHICEATAGFQKSTTRPSVSPRALW